MRIHPRTHASLSAFALLLVLLPGCGGAGSESDSFQSSPSTTDEAQEQTSTDPVTEYVACLHDHGLDNAAANPDGTIGYEFDEDDLDENGVASAASDDTTAIEAACREEVPGYTPPDMNER